jgi:hypothetical protein
LVNLVAIHGCAPGRLEWRVPKRELKKQAFCLRVALCLARCRQETKPCQPFSDAWHPRSFILPGGPGASAMHQCVAVDRNLL